MIDDPLYWLVCFVGAAMYWVLPGRFRTGFLLLLSFSYLATISPSGVVILLFWSLAFFYIRPVSSGNGRYLSDISLLWAAVLYLLSVKYLLPLSIFGDHLAEFSEEIRFVVPIGISYYTFKLLHYSIERRNGTLRRHTLAQFLGYIYFFPIYTAGPIEKFEHFMQNEESRWSLSSFSEGLTRICYGLIKKFILVEILLDIDRLFGSGSERILQNIADCTSLQMWALLLVTYLTLYLDFSAYSDIAIGTARLFGYRISENFNFPLFASTIVDFWRRWHMTLAGWVQSYVYMPLVGLYRKPILALVSAFIIIGIWHELSTSRIAWGLYHAVAIVLYVRWSRSRSRRPKAGKRQFPVNICGIIFTQLFIISSMAFLVGESGRSLYGCAQILVKLFGVDLPGDL